MDVVVRKASQDPAFLNDLRAVIGEKDTAKADFYKIKGQFKAAFASLNEYRLTGVRSNTSRDVITVATHLRNLLRDLEATARKHAGTPWFRFNAVTFLLTTIETVVGWNFDAYVGVPWPRPAYIDQPWHRNLYRRLIERPETNRPFIVGILDEQFADIMPGFRAHIERVVAKLTQANAPQQYIAHFGRWAAEEEDESSEEETDNEDDEDDEDDDDEDSE